jgi:hypothetical protein
MFGNCKESTCSAKKTSITLNNLSVQAFKVSLISSIELQMTQLIGKILIKIYSRARVVDPNIPQRSTEIANH